MNTQVNPIDETEKALALLRIEFEKYFNGAIDLPPVSQQEELGRKIRRLRSTVKSSVDRFRASGLEARFNSYSEMFNRRVRNVEEGRAVRQRQTVSVPRSRFDAESGIQVAEKVSAGAAAALYEKIYRGSDSAKKVDLLSFQRYLDKQVDKIRSKAGCESVQFRVTQDEGRWRLKAKPVR